jgi:predicted negative regulator of RcsB-dependent stress response
MPLDLEEQEQLAELKAWWKQHGNLIVGTILAVAVGFAGWQGWRWYQASQSAQAAGVYEALAKGAQEGDAKAVRDAAGTLIESYPRTHYAAMGALVAARFHFDRNDAKSARAQLQWLVENGGSQEFQDLARVRLAALLIDEKAYDEALKLLEAEHSAAYESQYAALRGDALLAKNQPAEARAAYKLALEKAGSGESAFRESVRMRLEALGG